MKTALSHDVRTMQSLPTIPKILETVASLTGLRFVCVARVTAEEWTACAVLDRIGFGVAVGDGLDVSTTLCKQVRETGAPVVIDNVDEDALYRHHQAPEIYGFQSYVSIPIFRPNGDYFGSLCGLDTIPANLSDTAIVGSMILFAELISLQLQTESDLADINKALFVERETSEFREQFIAVLGHDLRTPLSCISTGADLLMRMPELGPKAKSIVQRMKRSIKRITSLVDDVVDFTRGRIGGGIVLDIQEDAPLGSLLEQVVAELELSYPERDIHVEIPSDLVVRCDGGRISQLLSNLLNNALIHGDAARTVSVTAATENGVFRLSVTNFGPSIPDATITQLFKPFWRASPAVASQGLGLGLFIVSEIAQSHGGQIRVVSIDDRTTFVFTLLTPEFKERRAEFRRSTAKAVERRHAAW